MSSRSAPEAAVCRSPCAHSVHLLPEAAGVNSQKTALPRWGEVWKSQGSYWRKEMPTGVVGLLGTVFVGNSEL